MKPMTSAERRAFSAQVKTACVAAVKAEMAKSRGPSPVVALPITDSKRGASVREYAFFDYVP